MNEQQLAEVRKQIEFKKQSLIEWLRNTAKWDKWNNRQVPLAEAKEEIIKAIAKEFDISVPWDESGETQYKNSRNELVNWINKTFIMGKSHFPINKVASKVEEAMQWIYKLEKEKK